MEDLEQIKETLRKKAASIEGFRIGRENREFDRTLNPLKGKQMAEAEEIQEVEETKPKRGRPKKTETKVETKPKSIPRYVLEYRKLVDGDIFRVEADLVEEQGSMVWVGADLSLGHSLAYIPARASIVTNEDGDSAGCWNPFSLSVYNRESDGSLRLYKKFDELNAILLEKPFRSQKTGWELDFYVMKGEGE